MGRVILAAAALCAALGCGRGDKKESTVPELAETLKGTDPDMRYWAARELGKARGADAPAAVAALTAALEDPAEVVRMGAAYALADLGADAKSALPALQKARKDSSKDVRDAAAHAVKTIGGQGRK